MCVDAPRANQKLKITAVVVESEPAAVEIYCCSGCSITFTPVITTTTGGIDFSHLTSLKHLFLASETYEIGFGQDTFFSLQARDGATTRIQGNPGSSAESERPRRPRALQQRERVCVRWDRT